MNQRFAIVLAAGKGTRMKSKQYKVLHEVGHVPMITRVINTAVKAGFDAVYSVISPDAKEVEGEVEEQSTICIQEEQLGTAHAVQQAAPHLEGKPGTTLVLYGDTPLITVDTLSALLKHHEESKAKATVLTVYAENPFAYGRIIRNNEGFVEAIVEERDATAEQRAIHEINTGIYVFDNEALFEALKQVDNHNDQGEYYLPDVMGILQQAGEHISAYQMADFSEAMGINDRKSLAEANRVFYAKQAAYWMDEGVTFLDPATTYIDDEVVIGQDTIIEGNVHLEGKTVIGSSCHIGSQSTIVDTVLADDVVVKSSVLESAVVGQGSDVGPMAHLRPKAVIKEHVHIGNFVEVKNATIGNNTKVGHLTYIGDADLGEGINVSCGVIFSNYDGYKKHRSTIGDHSFIGANVNIVSPVTVADHSFLAAGSTITADVPSRAMGIARARQVNKPDYWYRLAVSDNPDNE
ncbi:MAG: bifunctional UDP-N-acetylglucosamine diphosphorylase/glucosamine-1-phosphate N-acetyltransferase GlmU [Aerococcus sp.]|nr:bifunctional UDP-N-acetylglucosamine diphosphorylase/glucosamine-1-phosphate N-acetyltransferase GlmU [Aerococcus sp.]